MRVDCRIIIIQPRIYLNIKVEELEDDVGDSIPWRD